MKRQLEGLCDLISRYIELCLISRHSIGIYSYLFQIMSEHDQTFDPNLLKGHCDLFSRISDFALYLGLLVYEHTSFTLCFRMTRHLNLM